MARISVLVCDLCPTDQHREVTAFEVRYAANKSARKVTADLCEEHAAPLRELIDKLPGRPVVRRRASPAPIEVVTDEDVKAARKTASRKPSPTP